MSKINSTEMAKLRRAAAKASVKAAGEVKDGESKKGKMNATYYVR